MKLLINMFLVLFVLKSIPVNEPFKGSNAVIKSEFIFQTDDVPFRSCHASTIVETEDGLVVSWFGGTKEKHPDVGIWVSRFSNGKWTKPVEVANGIQHKDKRYPTWNPVLFNTGSVIKLFYKVGPSPRNWWGEVICSLNNGKTWSNPSRLPEDIFGPIKNKPVLLGNGELLCPSSTEDKVWRVHMEISPDMGLTWERTAALNNGNNISVIQPAIMLHPQGKLQILCRSMNNEILSSWSTGNGRTWSHFESTGLPNPNSGIDAVTLKDGRHILIYNHIECKPSQKWGSRNKLNIAISKDGINWEAVALLENDEDENAEYSYPAVIQTKDGLVHITYTWNRKLIKHTVIDPLKIRSGPIINGTWHEE